MNNWDYSGLPGMDLHDALTQAAILLQPKSYMEIGVDGGGSLATVLNAHSAIETLVLSDNWTEGHEDHKLTDYSHIEQKLRWRGFKGQVFYLYGDSKDTVPDFAHVHKKYIHNIDLILVDGDHSTSGALLDLVNCWPLLSDSGVLVVDDVNHPEYPHLTQALGNFLSGVNAEIIPEAANQKTNCVLLRRTK